MDRCSRPWARAPRPSGWSRGRARRRRSCSVRLRADRGPNREAVAALGVGAIHDRVGPAVLYAVPHLVALVPPLALSGIRVVALAGVLVQGLAAGVQDSTVKALVAELVEAPRRATAHGVFAGIQGALAIVGGVVAGWLYETSRPALIAVVAFIQVVALAIMIGTVRSLPGRDRTPPKAP